jgi:hypothetical protein
VGRGTTFTISLPAGKNGGEGAANGADGAGTPEA